MLYQIGPLTCDTFPFEVGEAERMTAGDFAEHALIGRRKGLEKAGPGEDLLTISGKLLPFHIGGLSELDLAHQLCASLDPQFVMRGDGTDLGWRVILSVREKHRTIGPVGIGFEVEYEIKLRACEDPGSDVAGGLIDTLLSLFGAP